MEIIQTAWRLALTGFLTSFMFVILWVAVMSIIAAIVTVIGEGEGDK